MPTLPATLRLALLPSLVVVVTALGGCSNQTPQATATTAPAAADSTPSPTPAATGPAGCPVDAAKLEAAFKASKSISEAIALGSGFRDIVCYEDFAVARATPTNVDAALVLFSYDRGTGAWSALTGGTSVDCGAYAPPAVVEHLTGCDM
jgi:hypothetical protein